MKLLQKLVAAFEPLGLVQVRAGFEDGQDVVADRQFAEDRGFLRQVADAMAGSFVHTQRGQVFAVQLDAAPVGQIDAIRRHHRHLVDGRWQR